MSEEELLYDHYKDTNDLIQKTIEQRNKFFLWLVVVISLLFIFAVSPDTVMTVLCSYIMKEYNVDVSGQLTTIQSSLWVVLLFLSMRYYQSNVHAERSYSYLHSLEQRISNKYNTQFDREGGNYLRNYPKLNDAMDFLYKIGFPAIYLVVVAIKIISEIEVGFSVHTLFDLLICIYILRSRLISLKVIT